jgi:hypothetical protein
MGANVKEFISLFPLRKYISAANFLAGWRSVVGKEKTAVKGMLSQLFFYWPSVSIHFPFIP